MYISPQKNIRVTPKQWDRIENIARKRDVSANRLMVELAMEALEHQEWPRTEAESRFAAIPTTTPTPPN